MGAREKKRVLLAIMLIGFICIVMVVMTAYAAELRCENNALIAKNKVLQGEVDTLGIKIKTANNIEQIEKVAKEELGMIYPTSENCVYLSQKDTPKGNFAATIRKAAYK